MSVVDDHLRINVEPFKKVPHVFEELYKNISTRCNILGRPKNVNISTIRPNKRIGYWLK